MTEIKNLFGVTEEEIEKSKDILPSFDLGKIERDSKIFVTVLSKEPEMVEHTDNFSENKDQKIKTPVLKVKVNKVLRYTNKENIEIPYDEPFTLWLSSKSLSLGFAKIFANNNGNLENVDCVIRVTSAVYKKYGENRCYDVTEIKPSIEE